MPPLTRARRNGELFSLLVIVALSILISWKAPITNDSQITFVWLSNMALLLLFAAIAGHLITGLWRGVLIDSTNKISLSRFQMLIWTILILSGFLAAAVINLHKGHPEPLSIALHQDLWGLLGISTASLVGSPLIKNSKRSEPTPPQAQAKMESLAASPPNAPAGGMYLEGVLTINNNPEDASFADMFKGEEAGNFDHLDLGKIQMFFFTLLLWFVYAASLLVMIKRGIKPDALKIAAFPDLDGGMIALLGISHAAFLANKAIPHTPQPNP